MREADIQEFFAQGHIAPLTVTYEDFVSKYEETSDILGWLGLDVATATVAPPLHQPMSNWRMRCLKTGYNGSVATSRLDGKTGAW
jgi:Stf0 sulphotransferase